MRQNATESDGGANQCIQLFITTDGKLKVARGDALDLEILRGILDKEGRDASQPELQQMKQAQKPYQ